MLASDKKSRSLPIISRVLIAHQTDIGTANKNLFLRWLLYLAGAAPKVAPLLDQCSVPGGSDEPISTHSSVPAVRSGHLVSLRYRPRLDPSTSLPYLGVPRASIHRGGGVPWLDIVHEASGCGSAIRGRPIWLRRRLQRSSCSCFLVLDFVFLGHV